MMDVDQESARLYDEVIENHYDRDSQGAIRLARDALLGQLARHRAEARDVLDVAIGTGSTLQAISERYPEARLSGIDLSEGMLQRAKQRLPSLRTLQGDACETVAGLSPGSADLVLVHYLLAYVRPSALLPGVARILRPGGTLSLVTNMQSSLPIARAAAGSSVDAVIGEPSLPRDVEQAVGWLEAAGLEVEETQDVTLRIHLETVSSTFSFLFLEGWGAPLLSAMGITDEDRFAKAFGHLLPAFDFMRIAIVLARRRR